MSSVYLVIEEHYEYKPESSESEDEETSSSEDESYPIKYEGKDYHHRGNLCSYEITETFSTARGATKFAKSLVKNIKKSKKCQINKTDNESYWELETTIVFILRRKVKN